MKTYLVCFLILLAFSSCSKINHFIQYGNIPDSIATSLDQMSEHTKEEMLSVISHYSKKNEDSLKLKASYFLIKEIPNQFYYSSPQLDKFDVLFDVLDKKPAEWTTTIPWYGTQINEIIDSLEDVHGICCGKLDTKFDRDTITSSLLIENIELAFKAWQQPWSKHYTFSQFCEYILPYRSMNEKLENWRPYYVDKLRSSASILNKHDDVMTLAKIVNDSSQLYYQDGITRYPVNIAPSNLLKTSFADCRSIANHKLFSMRAMGIATAIDYVPQWANGYNGHYWNSLFNEKGLPVNFMVALNDVHAQTAYNWVLPKVYRLKYSSNPAAVQLLKDTDRDCPELFYNTHYTDVTGEYVPVSDITIPVTGGAQSKYIFLCLFKKGFNAVDFAVRKNESVQFKNVGRNVCYFPMYYEKGKYIAAAPPFILTKEGKMTAINQDESHTQKIVLTRKCQMEIRKENWLQSLVKGEIQVSNDKNFKTYKTIHVIQKRPSEHNEMVDISLKEKYRFARFVFSPEELAIKYWGDGASLAELSFFDNQKNELKGDCFGSEGKPFNTYTAALAFDKNPLTFFEDTRTEGVKYVGIDFHKPQSIGQVSYWARNDLNTIQVDNVYNLMYFNGTKFVSLGMQTAKDTALVYDKAPINAIFWLRNFSGGVEERIFTYSNGKQVWW